MAKGKAAGVHVVAGADPRLAEEALEELLAAAVGGGREHAVVMLRGDEAGWGRVLESARTGSLFADRRAIVVRNAEALKGEGDELAAYLDDPTPGVALILLATKPDRRRQPWRSLMERAEVRSAEPLKGRQLRAYVADKVRRRGLRLTEDGTFELLERVGPDLQRLMGELDKLEAFAQGAARPLGAEEVAAVLGRGLARPLYRLGDAMAARSAGETLAFLEELLGDGEPPLKLLGTLHRSLRSVRAARALAQARVPREQLAPRLGVPPFKVDDVLRCARRWSEEDLRRAMAALDAADKRLKTGAEPRSTLAAAVAEACREAGGGAGRAPARGAGA